ncbi:Putative bifunctional phosphatase/peptidyl-prolyl cis-trans isomerase [Rubripirellula lacrimiformis]|uniref:peptidylprolyl isomerase n=1 Tax=Rubripirellula lacrimiformis TaxID=1930273 RepID=A0A517NAP9_9BACT|nr:tandem-95 repeat protein [Rubripirellula lacrimiformis]QDT04205.1 Putative bifunctional phosphatase/peptidyl-prolyl cis-trans isomerase [Rubripirellula lacrimiformis]
MRSSQAKSDSSASTGGVRRLLEKFILGQSSPPNPKKGRLLLESLEQRQLMAGDMDLLFTDGDGVAAAAMDSQTSVQSSSSGLQTTTTAEGESAPDLVQFAKDLADAGVVFYGAGWCPACTSQKQLFGDGQHSLPFVEVTNPDRSLNATGTAEGISEFPTWDFPSGTRLVGVQSLATLSQTANVPIPQSDTPSFQPIGNLTVQTGSPMHIPIDAYDPGDGPLTVTVSVADPTLLEASVLSGNRSIRIDLQGYGDMVFELFEQRAPTASGRVADLAESGFYDGIIFHRVVDDFVIQAGDPTGTGTSGSTLGNFDDEFHPELQHNREGVLSFAKSADDTNNSQFFITETPTRFLDFNHSIFGQLVEGFDVREAISETAVNNSSQNKPINDVIIDTIDVFNDTENSVVMLKPIGNKTGTTTVTFTVTDADGNTFSQTSTVTVTADSENSQPFLNKITSPITGTAGQPVTLQLSSVDVEGDSVFYTARSASSTANGTVSVDSSTGLVTVTPASGFTGTILVDVGVSDTAISSSQTADDNQRLTFTIEGENVVAVPTAVDLQTGSDTGTSNIDNITNAGSLTFQVSGVTSGATVELVNTATGSIVGTAIASGTTVSITTNNIAALGDGTYPIAARQRVAATTSGLSSALSLVYDTTSPASVIASAATQANVGRSYVTDLISPEEGNGLTYTLTANPTGATINAATGVINWTPTTAQLGTNSFTLTLTDAAGNTRTENLTVNVAGEPVAEIKLEVTDLQGNVITSIAVGQEFLLNLIGVDARSFTKPGIYAAYADVLFDNNLVRVVPGSTIDYSDDFTVVPKGTVQAGLIDELGAVNNRIVASNEAESLIATVRMEALASGIVNIRSEPADESDSDVLIFGEDNQVSADNVAYGNVSLTVGKSFNANPDTFSVAEDSAATTLDVLANDTIITGSGNLSVVSVTQPAAGGTVTLTGGVLKFLPTADFNGTAVFTYRASDSAGIQETGSVTVTVTPVNDAPSANNDTLTVQQDSTDNALDLLSNDSFAPDTGETLTITAVGTTTAGGTVSIVSGGGSVRYTPPAGFVGTDSFTYTISDGTSTDQGSVSLTVESTDDPPTAIGDSFTVTEDAAEAAFDVMANDTRDVDNQSFVLSAVGTPSQGGTVRISGDGSQFFYRPAANFNGTETVTYTIRDTGGGVATGTATFTVTAANDAPPILDKTVPINRGGATEFVVFRLTELPANVDAGETLTIATSTSTTTTAGGTVRIDAASGTIFYTPPSGDFVGTDSMTYSISDGSLTSTGTLTLNVADYAERNIVVQFGSGIQGTINGLTLTGTNLLNETVEQVLAFNANGSISTTVLPGSYTVNVPAIPFLQNASQSQTITIESGADDGDATINIELGLLKAQYISLRDWMGRSSRQSLLVAVSPGEDGVLVVPSAQMDVIDQASVSLSSDGTNVTIRGTTNDSASAASKVTTTLTTINNRNVQPRGESGDLQLYRVSVDEDEVVFNPDTAASATTTTTTTGSSSTQALQAVAPESASQETASAAAASSQWLLGDSQAEGESIAAQSVTVADAFVPALMSASADSRAAVLPLEEGDLWVESGPDDQGQSAIDQDKIVDASSVDSAMQSVADSLTVISPSAEAMADSESLGIDAIDRLHSSNL